jgi:hypothetical protein
MRTRTCQNLLLGTILFFLGKLKIDNIENDTGHYAKWENIAGQNRFGGCWIGRAEFISHIVNHSNPPLPQISGQYHMMTLKDAVDYTRFLVNFTCDFEQFAVMVPDCGRPIISAKVTPDEYDERIEE